MSHSFAKVHLHIIFSTKNRKPYITEKIQSRLYQYIKTICLNLSCPIHKIGGIEDHVHILLEQSRTIPAAKIIETIKSNSSRWVKQEFPDYTEFSWQSGYAVFSVDRLTYEPVKNYIANQSEHHKKRSFKDELILILNKYNIKYDEQILWN